MGRLISPLFKYKKMKIKKNGEVITLTENDIKRIVKKSLNERKLDYDPEGGIGSARGIVQGEHDILNNILRGKIDIGDVFKNLQECFKEMPESCNAMNIVQNEECGLMKHLECIKDKM